MFAHLLEMACALALVAICASILAFAASPCNAATNTLTLTGELSVAGRAVRLGNHAPVDLDGPLAPATMACNGSTVTVVGTKTLDEGELNVSRLVLGRPRTAFNITHLTGTIHLHDDGVFTLGDRNFVASGALADALPYCDGLEVELVAVPAERSDDLPEDVEHLAVYVLSLATAAGEDEISSETYVKQALAHYATLYPTHDLGTTSAVTPRVRDIAICPVTSEVKVVIDSFGGYDATWQGTPVKYRFSPDGTLRTID